MKLIIDISKDIIESAKSNPNYYPTYHFEKIWRAIANGKLLPKGHGRLIDADVLVDGMEDDYEVCETVNATPTIIEADAPKRRKGTPLEENDSGYNCKNWIP